MESKTIKVSVFFITVLIAVYSAYRLGSNNMTASMLRAGAVLGICGFFILKKREPDGFIYVKDIFALMWAALYLVLPITQKPVGDKFGIVMQRLGNTLKSGGSLVPYYVLILCLFLFLQKWKQSVAYRVGLYVITSLLAYQLFSWVLGIDMNFVIYYLAGFAFLCEQISRTREHFKPLYLKYLLLITGLFVLLALYYPEDSGLLLRLDNLLFVKTIWPRLALIILLSGIICLVENHRDLRDLPAGKMTEPVVTGSALICLALYITVGKVWPQFFSPLIVYAAAALVILIMDYANRHAVSSGMKFAVWLGMLLFLPAAGRTLNEKKWVFPVIFALFIVHFILGKMKWKNDGEKIIMQDFWGIAAIVLLFSARYKISDIEVIRSLVNSLVVLIGSCVLWVLLTHTTHAFDKQLRESRYAKYDYVIVPRIQRICIGLSVLITFFILLLK